MAITTDEMRAKLEDLYCAARIGQQASMPLSDTDLAVIIKMDLEDALKAIGHSQRVIKTRAILVDALKACDALLKDK